MPKNASYAKSIGGVKTFFTKAVMQETADSPPPGAVQNGADIRGGDKGTKSKLDTVTTVSLPSGPKTGGHVSIQEGVIATSANYRNPKMK